MHPALQKLREATERTQYAGDLFLVGGCVRDELLGRDVSPDYDLVTTRSAPLLADMMYRRGIADHPPVIYERFGTAMLHIDGVPLEFVTARKESYDHTSRKPVVEPATLEEDARRRDFTCNALLRGLHDGEIRDPLGTGLADLHAGVLRTPLDPLATFRDDPLRMMRAVRFKYRLDFRFAEGLEAAIRASVGGLSIVSVERWRDELFKILMGPSPEVALDELERLGLLNKWFPEAAAMRDVEQGNYHDRDVWDHTRGVLGVAASRDASLRVRLAALLHDVGKPATRQIIDGRTRFFTHEHVGARMTREILPRWRCSNDETDRVAKLVANHMRLGQPKFSGPAARRLMRDLGEELDDLLLLVECDASALARGVRKLDLGPIREKLAEIARPLAPAQSFESPLDGREIMELLGLPPGPRVKEAKAYLTELVLDGDLAPDDKIGARERLQRKFSSV